MTLVSPEECRCSVYICCLYWSLCCSYFANLSVFLTWAFADASYQVSSPPVYSLQSSLYSAVRVVFPSGKSGRSIAHCKVFRFFLNTHTVISRLLSLDYETLRNFASMYFSGSSLAIFQDNHQQCQTTHNSPNMNFPAYLHTFGHAVPSAWTTLNFFCLPGKFQIIL